MRVRDVLHILDAGTKEAADRGLHEIGGSNAITKAPQEISARIRYGITHATRKTGQNLMSAKVEDLTGNAKKGDTVSGGITNSNGEVIINLKQTVTNHDQSETKRTFGEEAAHRANRLNAIAKGHIDLTEQQHEAIASHISARQEGLPIVYPEHLAALDEVVKITGVSADQFAIWYLNGDNDKITQAWETRTHPVQYSTQLFNTLLHEGMRPNFHSEHQKAA